MKILRRLVVLALLGVAACGGANVGNDLGADADVALPDVADPGPGTDAADPGTDADAGPGNDLGDGGGEDAGDPGPTDPGPRDVPQDPGGVDVPDVPVDTFENRMDAWFGKVREACRPPDLGCRQDLDCEAVGEAHCVGTGCVAPVQPDGYAFGDRLLAVTRMTLPDPGTPSGFDFTGDGVPDNVVASTIASFPDGIGIANRILGSYVDSGVVSLMLELRDAPQDGCGPLRVAMHLVTRDLDRDGIPEDGGYQVRRDGFRPDGYGPLAQLNTAVMDGTLVLSGPGVELPLKVPLTDGTALTLPLEGLRIEAVLATPDPALLPVAYDAPAEPTTAVLGGYVRLSRVVDEVNRQGRDCACAGVDPAKPLASFAIVGDLPQLQCDQSIDDGPCDISADGRFCGNIGSICLALMVMGAQADVATGTAVGSDGAPVNDALSMAFYLELAPALLAEPPLAPDFAAVGDTWRTSPDCDQLQDDGMTQIGVLGNDFIDPAVEPAILATTAGEAGATIVIAPRGDRVYYTPAAGWYGFDRFRYTIQDGHGNESSADVSIRVSPKLYGGPDQDLSSFCRNWCTQAAICDADRFASEYGGQDALCESDCLSRYGALFTTDSACGLAWRHQEICRATMPCFNLGELDAALAELAAGGNPAWYQCWDEVHARLAACGDCAMGTRPDDGGGTCIPDDRCHPDPCTGALAMVGSCGLTTGQDGKPDFYCLCDGGAMWDWQAHTCWSWCEPNPCLADPNATGVCWSQSLDWLCECKEAYYYDGQARQCLPM